MSKWHKLEVPSICERMIGFSIPQGGKILVISYEGVHVLHLGSQIKVETDDAFAEYDIYDPESGIAKYRETDYRIIGLHGGSPKLDGPNGERLVLDTTRSVLSIQEDGTTAFSMPYRNFSGDWAAATFSLDGRYFVLGCPYDFDFLVFECRPAANG